MDKSVTCYLNFSRIQCSNMIKYKYFAEAIITQSYRENYLISTSLKEKY